MTRRRLHRGGWLAVGVLLAVTTTPGQAAADIAAAAAWLAAQQSPDGGWSLAADSSTHVRDTAAALTALRVASNFSLDPAVIFLATHPELSTDFRARSVTALDGLWPLLSAELGNLESLPRGIAVAEPTRAHGEEGVVRQRHPSGIREHVHRAKGRKETACARQG